MDYGGGGGGLRLSKMTRVTCLRVVRLTMMVCDDR